MNSSIILTDIKRGNTCVINVSAVNILGKSLPQEIEGISNTIHISFINYTVSDIA